MLTTRFRIGKASWTVGKEFVFLNSSRNSAYYKKIKFSPVIQSQTQPTQFDLGKY